MNKKGFTLIELLAVIIILGILMIIAIPSVTRYISDSRKAAYIDTAKQVASATKNLVNSGKLEMYDTSVAYYIPNTCIKVENGNKAKSPYGEFIDDKTYVVVTYDGKGYSYYWVSLDDTGTGVKEPISIDKLEEKDIETDLTRDDVKDNNGVGKEKVVIFSSTCDGKTEKDANSDSIVSMLLNEKQSQLVQIDDDVYIFKGGNPDNYVKFNCDEINCETWRIIGIYGNQLKIQRATALLSQKFNDSTSDENVWEGSRLEMYLNQETEGGFYYSLQHSAKNMISTGTWYVGITTVGANATTSYENAKTMTLDRKVGLLSIYEYLYASDGENCYNTPGNSYFSSCGESIYDWMKKNRNYWVLPNVGNSKRTHAHCIYADGSITRDKVNSSKDVYPAVFLNSLVKIIGGSGTSDDPYTLGM